MINIFRNAWRRQVGHFTSLDAVEASPNSVKSLQLYGSSWETQDHSYDRCRELLPHCRRLVSFEIGWLNWKNLPVELAYIVTLKSVISLNVPINEFPYFLKANPRLKRLAIRGGDIEQLDDTVFDFRALRDLDLANNPLAAIPIDLKARLKLTRLELHDTPIKLTAYGLKWFRPDFPKGVRVQSETNK